MKNYQLLKCFTRKITNLKKKNTSEKNDNLFSSTPRKKMKKMLILKKYCEMSLTQFRAADLGVHFEHRSAASFVEALLASI